MKKRLLVLFMATVLTASLLSACGDKTGSNESGTGAKANTVFSEDDLPGKKIGVQLGTTGDIYASDYEEEGATIERYSKGADAVLALTQGKLDCVIIDSEPAKVFVAENEGLKVLDSPLTEEEYAIAIKKGNSDLKSKIDGALAELKANGTLQSIIDNYIGEKAGTLPYESPADISYPNGTLIVATNAEFPPYEYIEGTDIVGLDIDMAQAICDKLGMKLKVENMAFDSILAAVQSGKANVGIAGMTADDERRESVDFSVSYTTATQVIVVRK